MTNIKINNETSLYIPKANIKEIVNDKKDATVKKTVADESEYMELTGEFEEADSKLPESSYIETNASKYEALTTKLEKTNLELNKALTQYCSLEVLNDSEVQEKQRILSSAQDKYNKLIATNGKSDPAISALYLKQEQTLEKLDETKEKIQEKEISLTKKEAEIKEQEEKIEKIENELKALNKALKSYANSPEGRDEKEIKAKKSELQSKISSKNSELRSANSDLTFLKSEYITIKGDLSELNSNKMSLEQSLSTIEQDITTSTDTLIGAALSEYQTARIDYTNTVNKKNEEYKKQIEAKQAEVSSINKERNSINAENITNKESANSVAPSGYNSQKGQKIAQAAKSLYGNKKKAGGRCGSGVSKSINKALGQNLHGNGCDWGNVLSKTSGWKEVTGSYAKASDLKNLPAGAVVSWSKYEPGHTKSNGRYGHVFIADGNGNEISDFTGKISTKYADWGASYRVFIPT